MKADAKDSRAEKGEESLSWSDTGQREADAALAIGDISDVASMSFEKLLSIQAVLGHGNELGIWCSPAKWNVRNNCEQRIDLRERVVALLEKECGDILRQNLRASESDPLEVIGVQSSVLDHSVLAMTKILILCRIGPSGLGATRNYSSLAPSNVARIAYLKLPLIFAIAIRNWLGTDNGGGRNFSSILSSLTPDHFKHLEKSAKEASLIECKRISRFADLGLLFDAPSFKGSSAGVTPVAGEAPQPDPEKLVAAYQRLPDEYVSEMGRKSRWITKNIAPNVVKLLDGIPKLYEEAVRSSRSTERHFSSLVTGALERHVWIDEHGRRFMTPPFKISLRGQATARPGVNLASDVFEDSVDNSDDYIEIDWPPRTYAQLMGLAGTVQRAHIFIVLLSDGARHGELLAMRRDCLVRARNGRTYANGLTYKLVDRVGGKVRDWILPQLAVEAVNQQVHLVAACDRVANAFSRGQTSKSRNDTDGYLWMSLGGNKGKSRSEPLNRAQSSLLMYAKQLGMDTRPGGRNIHPHRFRKTLAWLCALAVTHSPKILKDVFGHKSFEMTLYYILSDKTLSAEIESVARELRVMAAKETVDSIVAAEELQSEGAPVLPLAGFGGGAARKVVDAVATSRKTVFARGEDWGEVNSLGMAQTLTMHGKFWEYVRPGIICIKIPGQPGRCNMHRGDADPSGCKSDCDHRLEQHFLVRGVDENIASLVQDYGSAKSEGDFLTIGYLAEQIRQQVVRFPALVQKWSHNFIVREVMETAS